MPLDLYHVIADEDCAAVRRYLVENQLTDKVSFRNIAYESHAKALLESTSAQKVPCLLVTGVDSGSEAGLMSGAIVGASAIIEWLKSNRGRY